MTQFEKAADEIFAEAGMPKEGNEGWWKQCVQILSNKMAALSVSSATGGCTWDERVEAYREQRDSLVEDMRGFKARLEEELK